MINKGGKKIKARKGGVVNISKDVAENASKIKARTGGIINIVNSTDTVYKTDTVKVPVVKRDTIYKTDTIKVPVVKPDSKSNNPNLKPIKELPYPKMTQPVLEQDNTMVDMSKIKSKAEYDSYEEEKTFRDFFPSNINMSGTSMGSYDKPMMGGYDKPMMKGGYDKPMMKSGCQISKHMGGRGAAMMGKKSYK